MFKTYIDNYHSNENKEYLDLIGTIFEYKVKIMNDSKAEENDYFYNETDNEYHVKYKKFEVKIVKPIYKKIQDEINKLKDEKKKILFEYNILKYNIINEINTEKDYSLYDKLVNQLLNIDKNIEELVEYYKKVNLINLTEKLNDDENIKKSNEKIKHLNDKFKNNIFKDDIEKKLAIDNYKSLLEDKSKLEKKFYNEIDYILLKKPKIEYLVGKKVEKTKDTKKDKKKNTQKKSKVIPNEDIEKQKRYKLKQKIKEKNEKSNLNVEEKISKLEKKIKDDFFAEFKFKNQDECSTSSYSADFFTKKPEILKIINKYPDIKSLMPKGYNKLPKDQICKELYKL